MSEFYDLSEVALNDAGQAWGNLGYWCNSSTDNGSYSVACRSLGELLGKAVDLNEQSVVFDAGFGCGDQLLLWLTRFQVRSITGVNYSQSQTDWARRRLLEAGYDNQVDIFQGDIDLSAVWRLPESQRDAPNRIVALDCLYHFPCRQQFLERSMAMLGIGGRIGVTDFMLADAHSRRSLAHKALRWMLKQSRIPEKNLACRSEYEGQMRELGFVDIDIVDLSEPVMEGFRRWIESPLGKGKRAALPWRRALKYTVTARFLGWAYRKKVLRYCLITAEKPDLGQ